MADQLETCTKCGQPKRQTMDASFTQWIFGNRSCSCDIPSASTEEREICPTCGKFVVTERKGSLTQWIMSPSLCRCGAQSPTPRMPSRTVTSDTAILPGSDRRGMPYRTARTDVQEQELDLDPLKFPLQRYKPIAELGKGASGAVYLCRDRLLSKKVAVKTLHMFTPQQLIAFQTEARAIANLKHPNIVELLDFGPTDSGIPYMVLEYFDGISLKELIDKNGALSIDLVIEILLDLAEGLSAAHGKGIFHRDISASNVLIMFERNNEPLAKLIDFGVASIKREGDEIAAAKGNTITGTPAYMSPDVVAGNKYDQRSEIYSLGCLAFETLTGRVPFIGGSAMETMSMHAQVPAPTLKSMFDLESKQGSSPRSNDGSSQHSKHNSNPEFSEELEQLIAKCLQKDPYNRYHSMLDLRDALERIKSDATGAGVSNAAREQVGENSDVSENANAEANKDSFSEIKNSASPSRKQAVTFVVVAAVILGSLAMVVVSTVPGIIKNFGPSSTETLIEHGDKHAGVDKRSDGNVDLTSTTDSLSVDLPSAFEAYKQAAERGNVHAFVKLGQMYENGQGVEKNYAEAMNWYRAAVNANVLKANRNLADLYYKGLGVPQNYSTALQLYRKAATANEPEAINRIGRMYENGQAVAKDYPTAMSWYNRGVALRHPQSIYDSGRFFDGGLGLKKKDPAKAIEMFKAAAAEGHVESQVKLGNIYFWGTKAKRNYKVASDYYQLAADQGNADGQDRIAYMLEMGFGAPRDYEAAMEWYQKSAAQGYDKAMNSIGRLYHWGRGVKKDLTQAMTWYHKAAEKGNVEAMVSLGRIFGEGREGHLDTAKAKKWLQKAASMGSHDAELFAAALLVEQGPFNDYKEAMKWYLRAAPFKPEAYRGMGRMYERGYGVKQNFKKALECYETAMKRGDIRSIVSIGCMYEWGYGVKTDFREAMRYYKQAAELGDSYADYCIGFLYQTGQGVACDYKEAMKWYQKAAAKNEPNAQYEIGEFYEKGLGVEKNYDEALRWYRLSAAQGDITGRYHLAYMYENGLGTEKDYAKALALYLPAARQGLGEASYRLSKMYENGLGVAVDKAKAELLLREAAINHSEDAIRELNMLQPAH